MFDADAPSTASKSTYTFTFHKRHTLLFIHVHILVYILYNSVFTKFVCYFAPGGLFSIETHFRALVIHWYSLAIHTFIYLYFR